MRLELDLRSGLFVAAVGTKLCHTVLEFNQEDNETSRLPSPSDLCILMYYLFHLQSQVLRPAVGMRTSNELVTREHL